ncbi:MAG: AAA family ATPase [Phaeodactylibacter sp.]|nr:AAA family ATPase [Phaeodactylibacter sp.]
MFMVRPHADMFVKPSVAKWFLRFMGMGELYTAVPSADMYERYKKNCHGLLAALADYAPRDMIDIQSFIWVAYRASRERTGGLDTRGQIELGVPVETDNEADNERANTAVLSRIQEPPMTYLPRDPQTKNPVYTVTEMAAETGYPAETIQQWRRALRRKGQVVLYGPPGTGKTFTASLLGKYTGREVFKIDLSMVISKYIGETEKNLATLFDKAQNKDWILFFDEADAIFGKRTNVRDAHDKYANQEVSYLLQRIELYPGLAILASNFKSNIDEAFIRRFNSIIYFPVPAMPERLRIWQKAFPGNVAFAEDVDFRRFAQQHELTGSHIMNIVQTTCLEALSRNTHTITSDMIRAAIQKELSKEEKIGR